MAVLVLIDGNGNVRIKSVLPVKPVVSDSTNARYVTDAQLIVIGNTSGTNTGDNATNSQYSGLASSKQDTITGLTASGSELNILDGATLTTTELNYVDGVTSAIQDQIEQLSPDLPKISRQTPDRIKKQLLSLPSVDLIEEDEDAY